MTKQKEWRCFFCGEVFTHEKNAAEHFGQRDIPACKIKGYEGHLITYIRKLEAELIKHRQEDTDLCRALQAMEAEHAEALRREEEKGYGRGVRDMTSHGYCPEPRAHK